MSTAESAQLFCLMEKNRRETYFQPSTRRRGYWRHFVGTRATQLTWCINTYFSPARFCSSAGSSRRYIDVAFLEGGSWSIPRADVMPRERRGKRTKASIMGGCAAKGELIWKPVERESAQRERLGIAASRLHWDWAQDWPSYMMKEKVTNLLIPHR